jgi:23S rRNA U2552 (ribose-2'-O)-methylase RlmE/FtsJ
VYTSRPQHSIKMPDSSNLFLRVPQATSAGDVDVTGTPQQVKEDTNKNLLAVALNMVSEPIVERVLSRVFIVDRSALTLDQVAESLMTNEFAAKKAASPKKIRIVAYPTQNAPAIANRLWRLDTARAAESTESSGNPGNPNNLGGSDTNEARSDTEPERSDTETETSESFAQGVVHTSNEPQLSFTAANDFDTLVYVLQSADERFYFGAVSVPTEYSAYDCARLAAGTVVARDRQSPKLSTAAGGDSQVTGSTVAAEVSPRSATPVCRAWLKIKEAVERAGFNSTDHIRGNALDIGASPGGWSYYLAETCELVIAVDPGKLQEPIPDNVAHLCAKVENCVEIIAAKVGVDLQATATSSSSTSPAEVPSTSVTHASGTDSASGTHASCISELPVDSPKTSRRGLDVLVCDMNCSPQTMLNVALWPFTQMLNPGAVLVLTCKSFTDKASVRGGFDAQVKKVVQDLEAVCIAGSIQVIHLMSNRLMERTVIGRWAGVGR